MWRYRHVNSTKGMNMLVFTRKFYVGLSCLIDFSSYSHILELSCVGLDYFPD